MKYFIISDIHGSEYYLKIALKQFKKEKADILVVLGDFYYHGPRNPLPKQYNPMNVAKMLNEHSSHLIGIRGNCDANIDEMISDFKMVNYAVLELKDKKVFLYHGHKKPKDGYDIYINGHFHKFNLEQELVIKANPSSVSLPKDDNRGYLLLEDHSLSFKDLLSGKEIKRIDW